MSFVYHFSPKSMTAEKYDECIRRLDAAGAGNPKGRLSHVCYEGSEGLRVFDVWDSSEAFDAFGGTLMPILQALGIDAGTPEVSKVHNVIAGR